MGHQSFKDMVADSNPSPEEEKLVEAGRAEVVAEIVADSLAALRTMRAVTQSAVAGELALAQSNVSRIEHQDDLLLSTLRAYVEGLGGRLELAVVFDDVEDPGNAQRVRLAV